MLWNVFVPIYMLELSVSIVALVFTLKKRKSLHIKSLYEQMIINIIIADLIFSVIHLMIYMFFEIMIWKISFNMLLNNYFEVCFEILGTIQFISIQISFYWAFWISFTIYQNLTSPSFEITQQYPKFRAITIILTTVLSIPQLFIPIMTYQVLEIVFIIQDSIFYIIMILMIFIYIASFIKIKKYNLPIKQYEITMDLPWNILYLFFSSILLQYSIFSQEMFEKTRGETKSITIRMYYFLLLQYLLGFFDSIAYKISLKNFEKDPLELSGIQTNITTELESTEQINN